MEYAHSMTQTVELPKVAVASNVQMATTSKWQELAKYCHQTA